MRSAATRLLLALALLSTACMKRAGYLNSATMPSAAVGIEGYAADVIGPAAEGMSIPAAPVFATAATEAVQAQRKLIWTGELRLDVDILSNTVQRAAHLVEQAKGYIQAQRVDDDNAHLTVRVPAGALSPTISALSALGSATVVRVSSSDITEQYVDTESRMKTARALRDRLQGLLDRATNVTEVLSVERELARVQAEIEASEARLRAMAGQVSASSAPSCAHRPFPALRAGLQGRLM
jgi:hypothetical protein